MISVISPRFFITKNIVTLFLFCAIIFFPLHAVRAKVIKIEHHNTLYYLDSNGMRHAYPSHYVYASWRIPATATIEQVTPDQLQNMPLGKNVTFRPGSLIKIPSHPTVYAVEPGGILRPLTSEQTAIDIYGINWAQRVYDLPEVFFHDYRIGASVRSRADLPDGTLVRLAQEPVAWYWKDKGVLQKFSSARAIELNLLAITEASVIPSLFPVRTLEIYGESKRILHPLWYDELPAPNCSVTRLRAAIIFLSKGAASSAHLETWRTKTASAWERRTDALSHITIDPHNDSSFEDRYIQNGKLDVQEISRTFYDAHPDEYDFIFIWNSLMPAGSKEIADFWPVTNRVEGLGKPLFDRASLYGSGGTLKGVIHMGRPSDYPIDNTQGMERAVEIAMHELLHQWSGEADFKDPRGSEHTALQTADGFHWSPFVNFISPLGGWGWMPNADGSFTSQRSNISYTQINDLHFPDLDLYLMGLIPRHSVSPISYLEAKTPESLASVMPGTMRAVSIDDIVYGNGVRRCLAESSSGF